jgi:hypothetical protein
MSELLDHLAGVPFLSDSFQAGRLLNLVLHKRQQLTLDVYDHVSDLLKPSFARYVYGFKARSMSLDLPLVPLTGNRKVLVETAIAAITSTMPRWSSLYSLPVDYMQGDITSRTCALIPQTVFLGASAFTTDDWLTESLLHENAHVWMDLLLELTDFQAKGCDERYQLPSGTPNKTITGVVLAAHFATSVLRFYRSSRATPFTRSRREFLLQYARSCLDMLDVAEGKTRVGGEVVHIMRQILDHETTVR